jgi:hypothetical protein
MTGKLITHRMRRKVLAAVRRALPGIVIVATLVSLAMVVKGGRL